MNEDDAISISSDSDDGQYLDRRAIFEPVVQRVVDALGGYEAPSNTYRLGDSASSCLSDLKKLWRKDDSDDDRTVARIFFSTLVLPNDLIPILLVTAGRGHVEDPRALKCADLICAMTWPIDMAEELKELDDEPDRPADYTQLTMSHLVYKAALLKPGVVQALFGIALLPLARPPKERTPRDSQVVGVILYIVRNLAFIKDPGDNTHLSADRAEYAGMQGRLIRILEEAHILELLLTIAANEGGDKMFEGWNTVVLEIFYLLFRGVSPASLTVDQAKQPTENLHRLLAAEEKSRRDIARTAASRHSRFGTTISVKLNPAAPSSDTPVTSETPNQPFILHRQQAIKRESGNVMDMSKKARTKRGGRMDELGREDNLGVEARRVLQTLAREFVRACFNPFLAGLLKDIKSERPKITEKDHLRLLFVTKWFLEFFLAAHRRSGNDWGFGFELIGEVTERGWIVWVLRRMREAVEDKPKQWTELQAGIECLTQLLHLIEAMSLITTQNLDEESHEQDLAEAAQLLQQQLIYNGEVLDIAFESLRGYREGTQSLVYLDASVGLAYAVIKGVERAGKGEVYVRKRKARRRKAKGKENDEVPDEELEEQDREDEMIQETLFTFEAFEMKFANAEITHTLLTYLSRYKEFTSSESMKRIVNLMHRQAVRAKAEGLFFKASTLNLFKLILDDQRALPRDRPYKDLISLINYILRQFFKALAEEPFLAIETFFPKNRGHWKAYSSYQPEEKGRDKTIVDTRFPQDVQVKKGYSWSQQVGIAIQALVEDGKLDLVNWTKDILTLVIGLRQRIVEETDAGADNNAESNGDEDGDETVRRIRGPSADAISKFTDYLIPYISDEQANAATKEPQLKLLFRLVKFYILDEDADELEWYVPAAITPQEMQSSLTVINQFLETPIDLEGKTAAQLLSKKARRRRRRRRSVSPGSDDDLDLDKPVRKKKEKKEKEAEVYKSAQFIEDSDGEYGDMEAFLEKERALRQKTALAAAALNGRPATMKASGMKKRRRQADKEGGKKKKRKGDDEAAISQEASGGNGANLSEDDIFGSRTSTPPPTVQKKRPRPRPRIKNQASLPPSREPSNPVSNDGDLSDTRSQSQNAVDDDDEVQIASTNITKKKGRLVLSDEE